MQNAKNLSKILKSICLKIVTLVNQLEVHFFYIHYSVHISIAIALILAIIHDTLHENKMSQKCVQCT